jgi:hypothetical protein
MPAAAASSRSACTCSTGNRVGIHADGIGVLYAVTRNVYRQRQLEFNRGSLRVGRVCHALACRVQSWPCGRERLSGWFSADVCGERSAWCRFRIERPKDLLDNFLAFLELYHLAADLDRDKLAVVSQHFAAH